MDASEAALLLAATGGDLPDDEADPVSATKQGTAAKAARYLVKTRSYRLLSKPEKTRLAAAFAVRGKILYGAAFDVVDAPDGTDFSDPTSIALHLDGIKVFEIKSTNRKALDPEFSGYFFALTTAELLVAQSLKNQYGFILVNTETNMCKDLSLPELLGRVKSIYPTWSIVLR